MTLRLILVRHGLSSYNLEHRIQGCNDQSSLTSTGDEQAHYVGVALAEVSLTAAYCSPLRRASRTADLLLETQGGNVMAERNSELVEIDLEPWSGRTSAELAVQEPVDYSIWQQRPEELVLQRANGSSYTPLVDLMAQADRFLQKLLQRHPPRIEATVLVVAHNAILRCLVLVLLGRPIGGFRFLRIDNASLSILNLFPHMNGLSVQIECLNSLAHLATIQSSFVSKRGGARLVLVRHGETDWNQQRRFQGQIDIPLNENGRRQAKAAGIFLSGIRFDHAFSSAMTRSRQTAEAILECHPGVKLTLMQELIEISHGLWEGRLEREIAEEWPELLMAWKATPEHVQMPAGETLQDLWKRSVTCWHEIAIGLSASETVLIVAHDAVNKTILCKLLGLSPADIWVVKQGNGGITIIDMPALSGQAIVVSCLNLTSHLGSVFDCTAKGAL